LKIITIFDNRSFSKKRMEERERERMGTAYGEIEGKFFSLLR
jgi:hypothetical protein